MFLTVSFFLHVAITKPLLVLSLVLTEPLYQAAVVQTLDSAIHRIKIYLVDNSIGFPNTYPLDSVLSGG